MATILFSACGTKENAQLTVSGLNPTAFDSTINGKKTELITLTNLPDKLRRARGFNFSARQKQQTYRCCFRL